MNVEKDRMESVLASANAYLTIFLGLEYRRQHLAEQ